MHTSKFARKFVSEAEKSLSNHRLIGENTSIANCLKVTSQFSPLPPIILAKIHNYSKGLMLVCIATGYS